MFLGNFIEDNASQHGCTFSIYLINATVALDSHLSLTSLFPNVMLDLVSTNHDDNTIITEVSRKLKVCVLNSLTQQSKTDLLNGTG